MSSLFYQRKGFSNKCHRQNCDTVNLHQYHSKDFGNFYYETPEDVHHSGHHYS